MSEESWLYHTPLGSFPLKTAGILTHLDINWPKKSLHEYITSTHAKKEGNAVFILMRSVNCHLKCKWNELFFDNSWHCLRNWLVHFKCKLGD